MIWGIQLRKLMGYRGLKVWMSYDMHISLLAIFYILVVDNLFRPLDSLVLISSLGFYFMYGFLINDFFDMPSDIAAGKRRTIQKLPKTTFVRIIFFVAFISAIHLWYLKEPLYITTYISSHILATLYSAPPIRFKSRGFFGIVVCALIEKMVPVLAIFTFFDHFEADTLIFLISSFFIHISEIITHQIYDYESDSKTNVHTFVVSVGVDKALKTFKNFISPISIVSMILLCFLICVKVPCASLITALVLVTYVVLSLLISKGKLSRAESVFPLYMSCPHFLINSAFPSFIAFILVLRSPSNILLLLVAICSLYYTVENFFNIIRKKVILREELSDT